MKIRLLDGRAIVIDNEIHTICENEDLYLPVIGNSVYTDTYAICIINGKKSTFKIIGGVLSIPPSYLDSGELLITIKQVKDGQILNTWICEKITLKRLEGSYTAIPEIGQLRAEIREMKTVLEETKEYFKGICEGYNII